MKFPSHAQCGNFVRVGYFSRPGLGKCLMWKKARPESPAKSVCGIISSPWEKPFLSTWLKLQKQMMRLTWSIDSLEFSRLVILVLSSAIWRETQNLGEKINMSAYFLLSPPLWSLNDVHTFLGADRTFVGAHMKKIGCYLKAGKNILDHG